MSNIVKECFGTHALILDTNILFHKNKKFVVDPKFDEFWSKYAEDANLDLFIPSVVEGELLYQQTCSALTTLQRANSSFARLTEFTGKKYGHRVTEQRIETEIKQRLKSWLKTKNAEIIDTPIKKIDWNRVINDSIWRVPPFSAITEKNKSEKGFRDYLILESVVAYCQKETQKKVIFITNDTLLRESTRNRLKGDTTVKIYSTLEEFESNLKLQKENFEENFVNSVIEKAADRFFKLSDKNSLIFRMKISNKLVKKYKDLFENPGELLVNSNENDFFSDSQWEVSDRGWFKVVGKPQFLHIQNEHTFYWNSLVTYQQDFKRAHTPNNSEIYLLDLGFMIKWKCNISIHSRFTKVELVDTKSVSTEFHEK